MSVIQLSLLMHGLKIIPDPESLRKILIKGHPGKHVSKDETDDATVKKWF